MALLDDLRTAANSAISAGAAAARGQGTLLKADFETLIKPNLDGVVVQLAAIGEDLAAGRIGEEQARDDLQTQFDRVRSVIFAAAELATLAAQIIINAVMDALRSVINAASTRAIGVPLL